MNQNGEKIGDVLIETFSYKPHHSLKYVLEDNKDKPEDETESKVEKKDLPLNDQNADTVPENVSQDDTELAEDALKDTEDDEDVSQDDTEKVSKAQTTKVETTETQVPADDIKVVEFKTFSEEDIVKLLSRSKRQIDDVNATGGLIEPLALLLPPENNNVSNINNSSLGPKRVEVANVTGHIKVLGLRVEESAKEPKIVDGMIPTVLSNTQFTLRLFGENLSSNTIIAFTHFPSNYGSQCDHLLNGEYKVFVPFN